MELPIPRWGNFHCCVRFFCPWWKQFCQNEHAQLIKKIFQESLKFYSLSISYVKNQLLSLNLVLFVFRIIWLLWSHHSSKKITAVLDQNEMGLFWYHLNIFLLIVVQYLTFIDRLEFTIVYCLYRNRNCLNIWLSSTCDLQQCHAG